MATAPDTTTSATRFFKTRFRNYMANYILKAPGLATAIDNAAREEEVSGTSLNTTWPMETVTGVNHGVLGEGSNYVDALPGDAIQFVLGIAHLQWTVQWTGHLEAAGSSEQAGWLGMKMAKKKGNDLKLEAQKTISRYMLHNGSANLCQVGAVSGGVNGYVTITGGCPIHFFEEGQVIGIFQNTTGSANALTGGGTGASAPGRIVQVDQVNGRLYLNDVTGAVANYYIAWINDYDKTVPNGLRNIVDNTGTIAGVNRATVGNLPAQAIVVSNSSGAMGPTFVDKIRDTVLDIAGKRTESGYKSKWCANRQSRRDMTVSTIGQNRFANLDLKMGHAEMEIADKDGDKMMIEEENLPYGELYAVDASKFVKVHPEGMKGGYARTNGDSVFFTANASSGTGHADSTYMYWIWRGNISADIFVCQGKGTSWVAP